MRAVAVRDLVQVLLVVVLGQEVLRRRLDVGRDRREAGLLQLGVVDSLAHLSGLLLRLARGVDHRAVLRADVVALAHALGGIVRLPEDAQQIVVADLAGVEDDLHDFGVASLRGADLLVARVRRVAAGVADRGGVDPWQLPEDLLSAPEAAQAEDRRLQAGREWPLQRGAQHLVPLRNAVPGSVVARERLIRAHHGGLVPATKQRL